MSERLQRNFNGANVSASVSPNAYIRPARPSDAPKIREIYAFYVAKTTISFEYEPPTVAEMERRLRSTLETCPYLVYCVKKGAAATEFSENANSEERFEGGERVVGYAYARQAFERAAYSWLAETTVYVDREFQGRGVGSALYRALIPLLRRQGFRNVCALVATENQKSDEFHLKNGFSFAGTLKNAGFKAGRWLGVDYFERQIGDCDANPTPPFPFSRLESEFVDAVCAAALAPRDENASAVKK